MVQLGSWWPVLGSAWLIPPLELWPVHQGWLNNGGSMSTATTVPAPLFHCSTISLDRPSRRLPPAASGHVPHPRHSPPAAQQQPIPTKSSCLTAAMEYAYVPTIKLTMAAPVRKLRVMNGFRARCSEADSSCSVSFQWRRSRSDPMKLATRLGFARRLYSQSREGGTSARRRSGWGGRRT